MMNLNRLKRIAIGTVFVASIAGLVACSSPTDKANAFLANGMKLLEQKEYTKANIEFRNALQIDRNMVDAIWGQVLVAEQLGKPQLMYKLLNGVLAAKPEHLEALVKQGRLMLIAGKLDKSLELSDRAMKVNDKDLSVLALRASILLKIDDAKGAVKFAKQVIDEDPAHVDALIVLASERLTAGDSQKAIEYLDQGLKSSEKNIALQLIKIKALDKLAKLDLAEEVFRRLIEYYPETTAFNYVLANFYIKHNRHEDAEKEYRAVVARHPDKLAAKLRLVKFLVSTQGDNVGLKQLEVFSEQEPGNYDMKFALVRFHISRNEIGLANDLLAKIISDTAGTETALKAKGIMAGALLAKGDNDAAKVIVDEILAVDKRNENGLILNSSINIARQKYEEAIGELRVVLRDTPNSTRALFFLAKAHSLSGSPELADEQYFKAFKISRFNSAYGLAYANFLLKRKLYNRAEKILQNVISVSPSNLPALKLLAQTRLTLGDWVGAQEVADAIKKTGKENITAEQIAGAILVGKKDYSEGIEQLKRTHQSSPGNFQPVVALVRTYLLAGKPKEAGDFLDAILNASPDNLNAMLLRGQVYASQGQVDEAISTYENAIETAPDNVLPYYYLTITHTRAGNKEEVNKVLEKGLTVAPESFVLRLSKASLLERSGKAEEAIKLYEGLLSDRPDADIVANNLASLLTENRTDQASLDRAYTLSQRFKRSEVPQFKDTFGWASYQVGKYADAGTILESAAKQLPGIAEFHYHLGMNHLARENKELARKELEKALELSADRPIGKEAIIRETLSNL